MREDLRDGVAADAVIWMYVHTPPCSYPAFHGGERHMEELLWISTLLIVVVVQGALYESLIKPRPTWSTERVSIFAPRPYYLHVGIPQHARQVIRGCSLADLDSENTYVLVYR